MNIKVTIFKKAKDYHPQSQTSSEEVQDRGATSNHFFSNREIRRLLYQIFKLKNFENNLLI